MKARMLRNAQKDGESMGVMITLFVVFMTCFFGWIAIQAAGTIVSIFAVLIFIYAVGGLFMEVPAKGFHRFMREFFRLIDTRNRVNCMEDYHGIQYTTIPEKHLYIKNGEKCELIIKRTNVKGVPARA